MKSNEIIDIENDVWYDLQNNIAENVDEAFYPPNNEVRDLVSFDICYDVMEIRIKTTLSTINQYVMEFPGTGSVWQMIDENTAKSYIDNSTIDEEYTKWLEQLKNK